jgi:hypothetical protein
MEGSRLVPAVIGAVVLVPAVAVIGAVRRMPSVVTDALRRVPPVLEAERKPLATPSQDARFTVYHPKEIAPKRWDTLLVYAHVPELQEWVHADAQGRLEQPEGHGRRTDRARRDIAKGAEITVVPQLPGCRFNPPTDRFLWLEDVHRREFRLRAEPEARGFAPGTAVNGCVAFYVASILVAEVPIWAFIMDQPDSAGQTPAEPRPPPGLKADWRNIAPMSLVDLSEAAGTQLAASRRHVMASAERYRAIFVSYAHEDNAIVNRLAVAYKILGDVFLRDQEVLRSGEKWNPRLLDLIERADIFQLYWSRAARRSHYVEQEWRHALQKGRGKFIRPVYWQKPMPEPPRELMDLHFAHLQLGGRVQAVLSWVRAVPSQ